jgi:uroporphyrinogen decarboxylase
MSFEDTVMYFTQEDDKKIEGIRERYIDYQKKFIREVCRNTEFESFVIGCSYSCNSLIGPNMWRQWDKPYIKAMADEIHTHGKFLHLHFHGRSMETVLDFAEIGIDCVCPFERGPGGDVDGLAGLKKVRRELNDKVTMNGNVHTVETLIRGSEKDVVREVQEIKDAFSGSPRLIIGTGDQVGRETPAENIEAMIQEAKK